MILLRVLLSEVTPFLLAGWEISGSNERDCPPFLLKTEDEIVILQWTRNDDPVIPCSPE